MHHYVHLFVHGLHALTVYGNLVFLHVHLVADLRADAVDRNAPRRDHLLCLAARSDAALRKHLLQSCIFSHSSKPFSVSLNL